MSDVLRECSSGHRNDAVFRAGALDSGHVHDLVECLVCYSSVFLSICVHDTHETMARSM